MGTARAGLNVSGTSLTMQPTTVSVGPYSLISRTPGCKRRHSATVDGAKASPPTTNTPTVLRAPWLNKRWPSTSRCAGVIFTKPQPPASHTSASSPSTSCPSGRRCTVLPWMSGVHRLVTVASKDSDDDTTAPASGR